MKLDRQFIITSLGMISLCNGVVMAKETNQKDSLRRRTTRGKSFSSKSPSSKSSKSSKKPKPFISYSPFISHAPSSVPSTCEDIPFFQNVLGDTCESINNDPSLCARNIPSFTAIFPRDACCSCGGGAHKNYWKKPKSCRDMESKKSHPVEQWTDKIGRGCNYYDFNPEACGSITAGLAKGEQRSANEVCCRCLQANASDAPSLIPSLSMVPSSIPSNTVRLIFEVHSCFSTSLHIKPCLSSTYHR
jgi:hypothetical protein